jgi:alkylhydroperoxidase family enzyme
VGREQGLSGEKLRALSDYRESPLFSETEKLALELADHLTCTPTDVPEALFRRLREKFSEAQLVEISAAIAWENYRARFNRVFDVGSDHFSEGAFCPLPVRPPEAAGP